MSKEIQLQYVLLADVGQYLFDGWTISDCLAGTHHGAYSVLMTTGILMEARTGGSARRIIMTKGNRPRSAHAQR